MRYKAIRRKSDGAWMRSHSVLTNSGLVMSKVPQLYKTEEDITAVIFLTDMDKYEIVTVEINVVEG